MNNQKEKTIYVIGTGFSGLTIAYYLVRSGFKVTLYEKENSVGGLLGTHQAKDGLVEQAANAFLANKELEDVSRAIGVKLLEKNKLANKRYIFRKGRARRWPLSLLGTIRLFCGLIFFQLSKRIKKYETLQMWGNRILGKEATQYFLAPAIQGVFADHPSKLSARLIVQSIFSKKYPKGRFSGSVCAEYGMGEWIDKMREYLLSKGCEFKLSTTLKEFDGSIPHVLAADLQAAKAFLKDHQSPLFSIFEKTESTSLTSVTLHFESKVDKCKGFGCLFSGKEGFHSLGVLFNHHNFPHRAKENILSETWILNDSTENVSTMDKDILLKNILADRKRLRGVDEQPVGEFVYQWSKRIPLYNIELEKALEKGLFVEKNLFVMGNYLGSLGLSKILYKAKELALQIEKRAVWEK